MAGVTDKPRYLRTASTVAAVILSLFTIDRVLARLEQSEVQSEARAQYQSGILNLRKGSRPAALAAMRRAHTLARGVPEYSIGLTEALIANGNIGEAEALLGEVLSRDSNDGKANLLLARLLAARSDTSDAIAFYHRAIYGSWRSGDQEASAARMELAEYLARVHRPQELLAESLLMEDSASKNPALARRVAPLFLAAGSGPGAAAMYRVILKETPGDEQANIGMGEASLLSGNYREAESMFLSALRHNPTNAELVHRLKFANELAMLDPTPRRLNPEAKYERAVTLLTNILREVSNCIPPRSAAPPIIAEAEGAVASKAGKSITNDVAESRLSLAERLWQVHEESCPTAAADDATAMIMRKLKRTQ